MPSPAETLTEAHRLAQARIGARTVADMLAAWSLLDPNSLDATTPRWLLVATRLIATRRTESVTLAAGYMRAYRQLVTGSAFPPVLAAPIDTAAISTSLTITGPVSLKSALTAGRSLADATETAQANASRAGMRHALNGGRDTIAATTEADPASVGYTRVTSGSPCDFCSMLAGRGAVYSDATAHFQAHDGCSCSAQPGYRSN